MMGSPYYYDILYDQGDIIYHDCMWSGDCTCCIQLVTDKRLDIEAQQVSSLASWSSRSNSPPVSSPPSKLAAARSSAPPVSTPPSKSPASDSSSSPSVSSPPISSSLLSSSPPAPSSPTRLTGYKSPSSCSSADNKKLRHREVEKNRHRQLQAMVKTLSERIPGRLDKETQVQTMKRAARYCVYLRDVLINLSHGQANLNKDKLEKLYRRSCHSVDLIMSQQ